jgi:PAS domain S-box-containing protein
MNFELWQLFLFAVLYLGLLFIIAAAAENKRLPESLVRHPLVYTLSLGVYATSWSYYGSVGLAEREGYIFLAVYLGVTIAFLASPVLLRPILHLIKDYQLSSLADLLAFRYHSQLAGILVTLFMLTGALPYIALQIQAVTDTLQLLSADAPAQLISLGFCLTITLFAILFGARHITPREKHEGLVVAIAFESLVKLIALIMVGLYAVFGIFNGFEGFAGWLENNPQATENIMKPIHDGPWGMMLLLSFSAAFLLPRQFHMIFVENIKPSNLSYASWAFPLMLLLLNLFIPPILWAGQNLDLSYGPDLYVIGVSIQSHSPWLPIFVFLGGVSAASAMIIVTSIALASMCLNHLILPLSFPNRQRMMGVSLYSLLIWGKRILIGLIILAGYLFYLYLQKHQELTDLGLIAFVAVAQFLPGIFGVLFWRKASRDGFISGLIAGALIWVLTLILPLFERAGWMSDSIFQTIMIPMSSTESAVWTLMANSMLFVLVSILRPQSVDESNAALACMSERFTSSQIIPYANSILQFEERLAEMIGGKMARHEIDLALGDLSMQRDSLDRNDLGRLRVQIRHNLSGLVGPVLAGMVVNEQLEVDTTAKVAIADTIRFVEESLAGSRTELKEMAGELDSLRRFHRQVLHDLPLAVVTVSPELQVVSWNMAMQELSGQDESKVIGMDLGQLEEPWSELLHEFISDAKAVKRSLKVTLNDSLHILNLFKSEVSSKLDDEHHGYVVLIEDHSEIYQLEAELAHSERLASIGRLATGVAHEIGNPVTGIACLAQDVQAMPEDDELRKSSLENILQLTGRITRIVQSLVSYSHAGHHYDHRPEPENVKKMIQDSVSLIQLGEKGKQIDFNIHCDPDLRVMGDYQKLQQVLVILLDNASDASEQGSQVSIEAGIEEEAIVIRIIDSGHGIEERNLRKLFDPFFTTKQAGDGTGLGLSLAYNIIRDHDGQIEVISEINMGTEFVVKLPNIIKTKEESYA